MKFPKTNLKELQGYIDYLKRYCEDWDDESSAPEPTTLTLWRIVERKKAQARANRINVAPSLKEEVATRLRQLLNELEADELAQ